ncbi:hypothetical protein KAU51_00095 [Candidatus Parcubacteria bacterium]|nr:hypothetical protein [Candidatus Parcubacteria bacterium]
MSKGERRLEKKILKEMQEVGKKTGWDVSVEKVEEDNVTNKTKEELKRSEKKDENNNNKNMGKQEKGEKIADKEINKDSMSKEEQDEILEARKKEAEKGEVKGKKEKREVEEVKPEKITRPWEETAEREEVRLYEEFTKKFELEKEKKDHIEKVLQTETDERRIEFAVKWFEEHREELEKKGISSEVELSKDRMAEIAIEKGAFKDLETNKKYKRDLENIENMYAMRKDFEKGVECPIESQFAILHTLDKRAKSIRDEIQEMEKAGKSDIEKDEKKNELDDLLEDRKELAGKIKGLDLDKIAEERVGPLEGQDSYIERLTDERKQGEEFCKKCNLVLGKEMTFGKWKDMGKFDRDRIKKEFEDSLAKIKKRLEEAYPKKMMTVDDEKILALMNAGYNVEEVRLKGLSLEGLFGRVELKKTDGTIEKVKYKEFSKFVEEKVRNYDQAIEDKAKEELGSEWKEMKRKREEKIKDEIEKEISTMVESPEKAAGGIEALFDSIKGRLINEYLEKGTKKERKTAEEIEELKEYEKKGKIKDPYRFMSEVIERKKGLDKISGDMEEDPGFIEEYLKNSQNIETSEDDIIRFIESQEKQGINLGEIVKSEKGLWDYFEELVAYVLGLEKKEENKE